MLSKLLPNSDVQLPGIRRELSEEKPNRRVREAHLQEIINGVIDVVVHIIIRPAGTIVELVRIIISPARLDVLEQHVRKPSRAKSPSVTKLVTNRI